MENISERIAKLPPEKRDLLLRRLRGEGIGASTAPPSAVSERPVTAFDAERDGNFHLEASTPGVFASLKPRVCPRKEVGPGQVLIEVSAASMNFRDVMIALGMYPTPPGVSPVMGSDCAGTIVAVGERVEGLEVGDEVLALTSDSFSAFATASAVTVTKKPPELSFQDAASIPTVFLTVYFGLHYLARLSKGERLLVHSAAGGIGMSALQLARWREAEVFATVGTQEKRELLSSMGVEHIMSSRSLDFADEVLAMTDGQGVDVVLNSLAGEAIPKGLGILRPLGRFVELGKRDIYEDKRIGLRPFHKGLSFFAIELSPLAGRRPEVFRSLFADVMALFAEGVFTPLPTKVFEIGNAAAAFEYMAQGIHVGKIVLDLKPGEVLVEA